MTPRHSSGSPITDQQLPQVLAVRDAEAHKASFGSVDILGGSRRRPEQRIFMNTATTPELERPAMVKLSAADKLLETLKPYATEAGFVLEEAPVSGGGSDANFTAAIGCPSIDGLGAEGDGAHTLREHIFVSTLPRRLQFWRNTLANLQA